jgi:hypothetical protein
MQDFLTFRQNTETRGDELIQEWAEYIAQNKAAAVAEMATLPKEKEVDKAIKVIRKEIRNANYSQLSENLQKVYDLQAVASRIELVELFANYHNDLYEAYGDVIAQKLTNIEQIITNKMAKVENKVSYRSRYTTKVVVRIK